MYPDEFLRVTPPLADYGVVGCGVVVFVPLVAPIVFLLFPTLPYFWVLGLFFFILKIKNPKKKGGKKIFFIKQSTHKNPQQNLKKFIKYFPGVVLKKASFGGKKAPEKRGG